jgi:2-amino-4-hydroxy-6-hydroxymethyldihydropteridine diphosphokinase
MPEVFVGLGANLGDPAHNLRSAVAQLRELMDLGAVSSLYRTEPVGMRDQPDFLNAVLGGSTRLTPLELMDAFAGIEGALGRVREIPLGPRTLDLDLLLYGSEVVDEAGLQVPHPRMAARRFVLLPLAEIAPHARHPVLGLTVAEMLARLPAAEAVERIEMEAWPPEA